MQVRSERGVEALALGVVQQRAEHRRHAVEVGDAVALHRRQRLAGVEFGHQGEAGADPDRGVHRRPSARRSGRGAGRRGRRRRRRSRRSCGETTRRCGRGWRGSAPRPSACRWCPRCRGSRRCPPSAVSATPGAGSSPASVSAKAAGSTSISSAPAVFGARPGLLGEAVPGEQQLRPGVLQVEGDLAPLQQHVHRHDDRRRRAARRSRRPGTRGRWAASRRPGRRARSLARASSAARRALRSSSSA